MTQHPLFQRKLVNLFVHSLARLANRFLSTGGAVYHLSTRGIRTRLHLFNYYAQLNGQPFESTWTIRVYSSDGKKSKVREGRFQDCETAVIELADVVGDLGSIGLCVVHINPLHRARTLRHSYPTIFFVEYYTEQARGFIHSLGYPVPKLYHAHDYLTNSIQSDAMPFLVLANSCSRQRRVPTILKTKGPQIEVRNYKGQQRSVQLDPIDPLASSIVDFRGVWPDLHDFLQDQPAMFTVKGPNVLYSPLFMQKNSSGSISFEHFQGLDWEDIK